MEAYQDWLEPKKKKKDRTFVLRRELSGNRQTKYLSLGLLIILNVCAHNYRSNLYWEKSPSMSLMFLLKGTDEFFFRTIFSRVFGKQTTLEDKKSISLWCRGQISFFLSDQDDKENVSLRDKVWACWLTAPFKRMHFLRSGSSLGTQNHWMCSVHLGRPACLPWDERRWRTNMNTKPVRLAGPQIIKSFVSDANVSCLLIASMRPVAGLPF